MSRNTIRKYLRSDAVELSFKVPARPSKLDPFADKLTAWLRVESKKSRKQKRTAKQLHGDLVKLQVAHTKLAHSRAFIVRANLIQTHEMLFDALTQTFRVLGGVSQRGI